MSSSKYPSATTPTPPNTALQRTRSAPLRSPLSLKPLDGRAFKDANE